MTIDSPTEGLAAELLEAGEHPSRAHLPFGKLLRDAAAALNTRSTPPVDTAPPVGWLCKSPEDGLSDFEHAYLGDPWREPLTPADKDAGWIAEPLFLRHEPPAVEGEIAALVERLLSAAERSSRVHREMAEAKSLRQDDNTERRTDLYMWPTPEQTLEGKAADTLTTLSRQLTIAQGEAESLRGLLVDLEKWATNVIRAYRLRAAQGAVDRARTFLTPDTEGAADGE